jgi:hypothetical protein
MMINLGIFRVKFWIRVDWFKRKSPFWNYSFQDKTIADFVEIKETGKKAAKS